MKNSILSRLRRGAIEAFVLRGIGLGLVFLMHTMLARTIASSGYGAFSYSVALAEILAVFVSLGLPNALLRFIAEYVEHGQWRLLRGLLLRTNQVILLSAFLIAFAVLGVSYLLSLSPGRAMSLRFAPILLFFLAFIKLHGKALQSFQYIKLSVILESVTLPLLVVVGLLLFSITTAFDALLMYTGAVFLVFLLGITWLKRSVPEACRGIKPIYKTRYWLYVSLPMVFGGIGQIIMSRAGMLILGSMAEMDAVGLYSAATRIARLNTFVLEAVNIISPPMIAAAFHSGKHHQFKMIIRDAMLWSTLGTMPLFIIMVLWPKGLLGFFGPEFYKGSLLLQILALGQFINALTGPVGFTLLVTGQEKKFARIITGTAVGNIIGNLIAIPVWGALGAAFVMAASVTINNGLMYFFVRKSMRSMPA